MSTSTGYAAPKSSPPPNEKGLKLDMADEWSAAAEAYAGNFEEHTDGIRPHLGMSHGRKMIVTRVTNFLAEKESPVVLDIAAAGGEPALSMAKEMPHATVYGTDFAPGMVDMMRKRSEEAGVPNLKARVEDGQVLSGFDDGSVDVVTCSWGLESMPDHQKAIEQFHRVLKPGGMAIFAAWDKDPNSIAIKMFGAISALGDEMSPDLQPLGGDNGLKAMENAGFIEVKKMPAAIPFYVPPSFGFRDILPFMIESTPINGILAAMEKNGRTNVREEACALFESQVLEDIAQGRAPTGPGLSRANGADPVFYMNAVVIEGYKKGGM